MAISKSQFGGILLLLYFSSMINAAIFDVTKLGASSDGKTDIKEGVTGKSTNINITNANIQTRDDCISFGDGCKQVHVEKVPCGPGHGISVGSLGRTQKQEPVVGFTVKNCTFIGIDNGVRIKTRPDSKEGVVSDVHFEDITMQNVNNPIVRDQVYCPWNHCNPKLPSLVKISNISIKNICGTSATPTVVKIACSSKYPCENVEVGDIDLKYHGTQGPIVFACSNVKPKVLEVQVPPTCSMTIEQVANPKLSSCTRQTLPMR